MFNTYSRLNTRAVEERGLAFMEPSGAHALVGEVDNDINK